MSTRRKDQHRSPLRPPAPRVTVGDDGRARLLTATGVKIALTQPAPPDGEHAWVVLAAHVVDPEATSRLDGTTMVGLNGPECMRCLQTYPPVAQCVPATKEEAHGR